MWGPGSLLYIEATSEHSFFEIQEDITLLVFFAFRRSGLTCAGRTAHAALEENSMAELKRTLDQLLEDLAQTRDELEVQIHLASADARDEFEELGKKWEQLRGRAEGVGKATERAAADVGDALSLVADEIKKATSASRACSRCGT